MENVQIKINGLDFEHIGWKYYNSIKKKAMEQEFSWSGLLISLSIAFFIVVMTALALNFLHGSLGLSQAPNGLNRDKLYRLETGHSYSLEYYLHTELIGEERLENIKPFNLA